MSDEQPATDPDHPLTPASGAPGADHDSCDPGREVVGTYVALEWYDGPLLEIAPVDFANGDRMVQVCSLCMLHDVEQPPSGRLRGAASGVAPWQRATIRLTRDDLRKMLDMIDGRPVKGYLDD